MSAEHEALREALARESYAWSSAEASSETFGDLTTGEQEFYLDQADDVLAILPQHAAAVIRTLGTVREGWLRDYDQVGEGTRGWCVYPNNVRGAGQHVAVVSLGAAAKDATDE